MRDSFDMWSRNVKQPNEMKEATLFALEQRMNSEEMTRLAESTMMKDILGKLIYSLQQHIWTTSMHLRTKNYSQFEQYAKAIDQNENIDEKNKPETGSAIGFRRNSSDD